MKILLVEDDEIFVDHLSTYLTNQNYTVEAVTKARTGWEYAQAGNYDLIVLDVNLPDLDGISLCQKLRKANYEGAILLLTAKSDSTDKVKGLDAGADDYVVKPCTSEELCARVRALLRRPREIATPVLQWGALQLDPSTCEVYYNRREITLSPKEYSLLELFLRYPQRVFSSEALLERLWSFDETPGEETVRTHIKRLRRKLKQAGAEKVIENIYGMGYRLVPPPVLASELPVAAAASPPLPLSGSGQGKHLASATIPANPCAHDAPSPQAAARTAAIAALSQFRPAILERLAVLDQALAALQVGTWSDQQRQQAYQAAHKLTGSLGMFGLMAGSEISRHLESTLHSAPLNSPHLSQTMGPLLEQLHQVLDPALATTASPPQPAAPEPFPQPMAGAPGPSLLVISANPVWLAELTAIAPDTLHIVSALQLSDAQPQMARQPSDILLLEMASLADARSCLAGLTTFAQTYPDLPILVLPHPDTFQVRLNIARSCPNGTCLSQSTTPQQALDSAMHAYQKQQTPPLRILAVDDDPLILAALGQQLAPQGLQVTTLENPCQLWDVLSLVNPDLLLLDFEMPDVDGVELCQVIRSDRNWHHLPILFLSGQRDPEVIQQMYRAGADDYVPKPFVASELITRIRNRIHRHRELNA